MLGIQKKTRWFWTAFWTLTPCLLGNCARRARAARIRHEKLALNVYFGLCYTLLSYIALYFAMVEISPNPFQEDGLGIPSYNMLLYYIQLTYTMQKWWDPSSWQGLGAIPTIAEYSIESSSTLYSVIQWDGMPNQPSWMGLGAISTFKTSDISNVLETSEISKNTKQSKTSETSKSTETSKTSKTSKSQKQLKDLKNLKSSKTSKASSAVWYWLQCWQEAQCNRFVSICKSSTGTSFFAKKS